MILTALLRGLGDGFHVGYQALPSSLHCVTRNHPSSLANYQVVESYIANEIAGGRMVGPLVGLLRDAVHCSPIGLVPKGMNTGQWHMIVDLSCPAGGSVNSGIAEPWSPCSLSYSSLDDATMFVRLLGPGTLLIKVDLKSAYRIVPLHRRDRHLFGVCWRDNVYVDQALPFGLRSAPKHFTAVADALGWALMTVGISPFIHYLDDFLFFCTTD